MKKLLLLLFLISTSCSAQIDVIDEAKQSYVKIEPIVFGTFHEKQANAINWTVQSFNRGQEIIYVHCSLITAWIDEKGVVNTKEAGGQFTVEITREVLARWMADDSVIDDEIIKYSPDFIKAK